MKVIFFVLMGFVLSSSAYAAGMVDSVTAELSKSYQVIDGSDRVTSKWVSPASFEIGQPCIKTEYSYTSSNTNFDKVKETQDYWNEYMVDLAVELRTALDAHVNSYGASTGAHKAKHTAAIGVTAMFGNQSQFFDYIYEMATDYDNHDADAVEATPTYHIAAETSSLALPYRDQVMPTTITAALGVINDLKYKYNLHIADETAHRSSGTQITTTDAVDMEK